MKDSLQRLGLSIIVLMIIMGIAYFAYPSSNDRIEYYLIVIIFYIVDSIFENKD